MKLTQLNEQTKRATSVFLTIIIFSSLATILLSYIIGQSWMEDKLDPFEVALLTIVPGLLFFLIICGVNSVTLSTYRKDCFKENVIPIKWGYQLLIISLGTIIASTIIDYIYLLFDNSFHSVYSKAIEKVIRESGQTAETASSFIELPFFLQNIFANAFFIILANLITIPLIKSVVKDPSQKDYLTY